MMQKSKYLILNLLLLIISNLSFAYESTAVITNYNLEARTVQFAGTSYMLADNVTIYNKKGQVGTSLLRPGMTVKYQLKTNSKNKQKEVVDIEIISNLPKSTINH